MVGLSNVSNLAPSGYLTDLSSGTTNAVSITVGGTTKTITAATMKTSLGLGSLAYKNSLGKSDIGLGNVDNLAASGYLTALASDTTNAVSITIGGTTKNITAATMKTSLGLKALAYKDSLSKSDVGLGNVANSTYAGGTAVTLNGSSKASSTASFYAPTTAGTSGYWLKSNGSGAPTWETTSNITTLGTITSGT